MRRGVAVFAMCLVLSGCSDRQEGMPPTAGNGTAGEALPRPQGDGGSITGMPEPGTVTAIGTAPVPTAPVNATQDAPPADVPEDVPDDVAVAAGDIEPHTMPDNAGADADPATAVAVIRDYYAAINARDYASAWGLWREGGNPQSPEQFAAGFAQTAGSSVQIGAPGPVDAGAGQRRVEIPVRVSATQADGTMRHYIGSYVLQRSVVDGGDPQWRIARAHLTRQ